MTVRITKPKINVREALNNKNNISFRDLEQRGVKIGESGSELESVLTLNNTDSLFPALVIKGNNSGSTTGYMNDETEEAHPDGYKEQNVGVGPWIVMDNHSNGLADGYPKTAGVLFKANNAESDYHLAGGHDYAYMMFKRTNFPDNNAAQIEFGTQSGGTDFPAKTNMTISPQGNVEVTGMLRAPANIGMIFQNQEIVDTGIYVGDSDKYGCGIFEITVSGNPNHNGSGSYRACSIYHLHVTTGWNGSSLNTMLTSELLSKGSGGPDPSDVTGTFVLWDETTQTEYTADQIHPNSCPTRDSNHQLRIKVSGHSIASGIRVTVKCLHRESFYSEF